MNLIVHENVEARLKARGLSLLEAVDPTLGHRPFRGQLAHDLAAIAEKNFRADLWAKVPEPVKKRELRAMLEAVLEGRGPFAPEVENGLPTDVRAEYQGLLKERAR